MLIKLNKGLKKLSKYNKLKKNYNYKKQYKFLDFCIMYII